MSSSPDDFGRLRALLRLKRYEHPPSRCFNDLSHGVHDRLRGPEGLREQSLLGALGIEFGLKPVLFFGLGVVCLVVAVYGVTCLMVKAPSPAPAPPLGASPPLHEEQVLSRSQASPVLAPEPAHGAPGMSTNPVLSPVEAGVALDPVKLRPTPVGYQKR